jgi:hypothetical protein
LLITGRGRNAGNAIAYPPDQSNRADEEKGAISNHPRDRPALLLRESIRREADQQDQEESYVSERPIDR